MLLLFLFSAALVALHLLLLDAHPRTPTQHANAPPPNSRSLDYDAAQGFRLGLASNFSKEAYLGAVGESFSQVDRDASELCRLADPAVFFAGRLPFPDIRRRLGGLREDLTELQALAQLCAEGAKILGGDSAAAERSSSGPLRDAKDKVRNERGETGRKRRIN